MEVGRRRRTGEFCFSCSMVFRGKFFGDEEGMFLFMENRKMVQPGFAWERSRRCEQISVQARGGTTAPAKRTE